MYKGEILAGQPNGKGQFFTSQVHYTCLSNWCCSVLHFLHETPHGIKADFVAQSSLQADSQLLSSSQMIVQSQNSHEFTDCRAWTTSTSCGSDVAW